MQAKHRAAYWDDNINKFVEVYGFLLSWDASIRAIIDLYGPYYSPYKVQPVPYTTLVIGGGRGWEILDAQNNVLGYFN